MPFGAEIEKEGVRFLLWAPAAGKVTLCLEDRHGSRRMVMDKGREGWHQCLDEMAEAGSRYRFQIDDGMMVPDPASRFQPGGVHGPSEVTDPLAWNWNDGDWPGRPLEEAVFYELHVGTFSASGTFAGVRERLDYLVELGVTAIELMPVAAFAGCRNWGYDGVLPFAPSVCYGRPEELKALVETAHSRRLMVFLDVVYNHFGPEGNYLHLYAPAFFTDQFHTPWGEAIRFSGPHSRWVRQFFIENALYWLEEFHFDGLRLDAVHAIFDSSKPDILEELAIAVREGPGKKRQVHLILENDGNEARYIERKKNGRPPFYNAQWNDDAHHALHVLLTGEMDGYYVDYGETTTAHLGRCLAEGFAYQGEISVWRGGKRRGTSSVLLPPAAFVNFLQNHDQIGNRAFGERLTVLAAEKALKAATAILLLSPQLPLLFMGQEWGCCLPFLYFCDFGDDLAPLVREGRRLEFGRFSAFAKKELLESIPDPCTEETFRRCLLDWDSIDGERQRQWLDLHRRLLDIRRRSIVPRLGSVPLRGSYRLSAEKVLLVEWRMADDAKLTLTANFDDRPFSLASPAGEPMYESDGVEAGERLDLSPWSVAFFLDRK
jgi:maltooligosyltrehalose trehalohydrolase